MFVYVCHLLRLKIASPEDTPVEPVYPSLSNTHNVEMLIFCFNCIKFKNNCKTNVLLPILHLGIPFFLCSSIRIYHIRWFFFSHFADHLFTFTHAHPRFRGQHVQLWCRRRQILQLKIAKGNALGFLILTENIGVKINKYSSF